MKEDQKTTICLLCKFKKAFDRINWVKLIVAEIRVDWKDKNLTKELYVNKISFLIVGKTLSEFKSAVSVEK